MPPVDAPMSKTIAEPTAGSSTAKQTSSHRSPVIEDVTGKSHSKSDVYPESANDAKALHSTALRSRNARPSSTSTTFRIHMYAETGSAGTAALSRIAKPVVPPKARWLGVLKSTSATAVRTSPALSSAKKVGKL